MLALYLSMLSNETERLDFEKLYQKYNDSVLKYAKSKLRIQENAEDVAQDTWFWIAEHFERFYSLDDGSVGNYIMKIVSNRCNDAFRKQKRDRAVFSDEISVLSIQDDLDKEDVFLAFCEKEDINTIISCIKSLEPRYRDVLNMYYLCESNPKEIAKILQLKYSTVRQRLARGRRMLQDLLQERGVSYEFQS